MSAELHGGGIELSGADYLPNEFFKPGTSGGMARMIIALGGDPEGSIDDNFTAFEATYNNWKNKTGADVIQ